MSKLSILLMDDVVTPYGSMLSGPTAGLTRHGFLCEFDSGSRNESGALLPTADSHGKQLAAVVKERKCVGVVLDHHWADGSFCGFDIWQAAVLHKIPIKKENVVFVTQYESANTFPQLAVAAGFTAEQAQYKHAQGNEAVVRYFCRRFGVPFREG
ncbi:MAG: hypothetical protein NT069_24615 [Planctomycetota bacterium]|nr:hypothetical protein [Planctomycetota bacterium]